MKKGFGTSGADNYDNCMNPQNSHSQGDRTMKQKALFYSAALLVVALGFGCQMTEVVKENTEGIKTIGRAIERNTAAVVATRQTMESLESTLEQVNSLKEPMQNLAELGRTFEEVAALEGPMEELARLGDPMVQVAELEKPLLQVASLETDLEAVARLDRPLRAVAELKDTLESVAGLRNPMAQLATLKISLDQVARLERPMSDLARLEEPLKITGQLSNSMPALGNLTPAKLAGIIIIVAIVFFVLLFLTIWGAVRLGSQQRSV